MTKFGRFATIAKSEEQDDGTIRVWGFASSEERDAQGEIVRADAIKAALPGFFKYGTGNLREMHQPIAAGNVLKAEVHDDGRTEIEAHVVDTEACKKLRHGVYKGFSIGGNVVNRDKVDKSVITAVTLAEISLVDRPANPEAVLTVWKVDGAQPPAGEGGEGGDAGATGAGDDTSSGEPAAKGELPKTTGTPEQEAAVAEIAKLLDMGDVDPVVLAQLAREQVAKRHAETPIEKRTASMLRLDLKKYAGEEIYDARMALDALSTVFYLLSSEVRENENEPGQVADLVEVVTRLKSFIASEVLENNGTPGGSGDAMAMAAAAGSLSKAGARYSAATKSALSEIHGALKECCTKMDGLGYADDTDDGGEDRSGGEPSKKLDTPAAGGEPVQKVDGEPAAGTGLGAQLHAHRADPIAKANRALEQLASQVAGLRKQLGERDGEIDALKKRLDAQPAAPKAILPTDGGTIAKGIESQPVVGADGRLRENEGTVDVVVKFADGTIDQETTFREQYIARCKALNIYP